MIHETALVDPQAELDSTVEVGPFCKIGPKVKIGAGTRLKSHVVVDGRTTIGENNDIFPFVVVGGTPQDLKYNGEDTRVEIGNNNTIRESVTMNLGTEAGGALTKIGDHNLLMAYVHLGHDCIVGDHCVFSNGVGLAGHVVVGDYAIINGQTGVSQFVHIGTHTYIGGQSGVERNIPPFSIGLGSRPMTLKGANIVGMRRRGFPVAVIQQINEAIKLWTRSDIPSEQCLLEIESQYGDTKEIQQFLQFIRKSKQVVK